MIEPNLYALIDFLKIQEDFYQALYTQSQAQFATYVAQGTVLNNYAHIFDILIRLRQAVDHPYLVIHSESRGTANAANESLANMLALSRSTTATSTPRNQSSSKKAGGSAVSVEASAGEVIDDDCECCLCRDPAVDVCRAACGHFFCKTCVLEYLDTVKGDAGSKGGDDDGAAEDENDDDDDDDDDDDQDDDEDEAAPLSRSSAGKRGNGRAPSARASKVSSSSSSSSSRGSRSASSGCPCPECGEELTVNFNDKFVRSASGAGGGASNAGADAWAGSSSSVWDTSKRRRKSILSKLQLDLFQSSTKMESLMEELHKMQQNDLGAKAIVFSQFVNMLDLVEYRLQRGGIKCLKLLGYLTVEQRDVVIRNFKDDPEVKVLLISLKAGGVALNLTVANYIYLLDPWW